MSIGAPAVTARRTSQQVRRALARAVRVAALDVGEVAALFAATGEELDRLTAAAATVRDAGLVAAGRPGVVTSPKEETTSRMASSDYGSARIVAELTDIAAGIDRLVRERTTLYGEAVR